MATGGAVSFFDPWPGTGGLKDLALLKLWSRSQLRLRFSPCPGNIHMPPVRPLKKKKKVNMALLHDPVVLLLSVFLREFFIQKRT